MSDKLDAKVLQFMTWLFGWPIMLLLSLGVVVIGFMGLILVVSGIIVVCTGR